MSLARDQIELERMPAWTEYVRRIQGEIEDAESEIAAIDTEGKTAEAIGVEHIRIDERIKGLKRALEIPEIIKREPADDL